MLQRIHNPENEALNNAVPEMTYDVFSGTLNPTHFTSLHFIMVALCNRADHNIFIL